MSDSPWTSDDPRPEDLDAALANTDGWVIEGHPGGQTVRTHITVDLVGDDAERLARISAERGEGHASSPQICSTPPTAERPERMASTWTSHLADGGAADGTPAGAPSP